MAAINTDICIFGTSVHALALARCLTDAGLSVVLVESTDRVGSSFRPTQTPFGMLSKGFNYWPNNSASDSAIKLLSRALNQELAGVPTLLTPKTYSKGQLHSFVGFGEAAPEFVDELTPFLNDSVIIGIDSVSQMILNLENGLTSKILFGSKLGKIETSDGLVVKAELEDGRTIAAKGFVFCEGILDLFNHLPTEEYSQRDLHRLHRTPLWSALLLDVIHPTMLTDERGVYLLSGQVENSIPFVGAFDGPFEAQGKQLQASHWLAFLPQEQESEEVSADLLREMKRQIKRVLPNAFNSVAFEKITVIPKAFGRLPLKTDAQFRWPTIQNLWIPSGYNGSSPHQIDAMCQSLLVLESVLRNLRPETFALNSAEANLPIV